MIENKEKPHLSPLKNRTNDGSFFIYPAPDMTLLHLELSSHPQWESFETLINEKRYSVKDTDATYRAINHWTDEGLLEDGRESNSSWRKLSFKDMVWLRILRDLRRFGLSLDMLRTTFKTLGPNSSLEFEAGLSLCFLKPTSPVFIVVMEDGRADTATLRSLHITEYMVGYELPYIRINLNAICAEILGTNKLMPTRENPIDLINAEKEIITALRQQTVDEIKVKKEDGKIRDFEQTERFSGKQQVSKLISEMNFGEIKTIFQAGKPVAVTRISKKKV